MTWHRLEQQLYEVQEYRTHCPPLQLHHRLPNGEPNVSVPSQASIDPFRTCTDFLVYVYPATAEESEGMSNVYRAVR